MSETFNDDPLDTFDADLYEELLTKSIEGTILETEMQKLSNLITLSLRYPEIAKFVEDKLIGRKSVQGD